MKIIAVQFSNQLINHDDVGSEYYDKLYSGARPGYYRGHDFWEVPQWVALLAGNIPALEFHVCTDLSQTVKFLVANQPDWVCCSALEVNKEFIRDISTRYTGPIAIGGYVDMGYFNDYLNIIPFYDIRHFCEFLLIPYKTQYDYRHFKGMQVIPRLQLSRGCLHRCSFCDVSPHGQVIPVDTETIYQSAMAFRHLDFQLVYIDDKTFGQCENSNLLYSVYSGIRSYNPEFIGFIIQTSAYQVLQFHPSDLNYSHVVYCEIGVESFNDTILEKYHKPAREKMIKEAIERLYVHRIKVIPNIIVGFPEETRETYQQTLEFLTSFRFCISHLNIYNLAVYKDTELGKRLRSTVSGDQNENVLEKSYMKDVSIHQDFANKVYKYAMERLTHGAI